ncbi:hypothetical protein D9_0238 [Aeromonas phage D9]|nr:hypothetical protein D9_0238 [Aeromonas phage D9]
MSGKKDKVVKVEEQTLLEPTPVEIKPNNDVFDSMAIEMMPYAKSNGIPELLIGKTKLEMIPCEDPPARHYYTGGVGMSFHRGKNKPTTVWSGDIPEAPKWYQAHYRGLEIYASGDSTIELGEYVSGRSDRKSVLVVVDSTVKVQHGEISATLVIGESILETDRIHVWGSDTNISKSTLTCLGGNITLEDSDVRDVRVNSGCDIRLDRSSIDNITLAPILSLALESCSITSHDATYAYVDTNANTTLHISRCRDVKLPVVELQDRKIEIYHRAHFGMLQGVGGAGFARSTDNGMVISGKEYDIITISTFMKMVEEGASYQELVSYSDKFEPLYNAFFGDRSYVRPEKNSEFGAYEEMFINYLGVILARLELFKIIESVKRGEK